MIQAKLGDSIRLECNATGDSPITVDWFREGTNETIEKHGNDLYDIHESTNSDNSFGLSSYMQIRSIKAEDALLYKCLARNEYGSSERLLKLIVLNAPEKPTQLRVRDVWSRSALITWQIQQPSNSRITNYTVQYWRKSGQYYNLMGQKNHRREETVVDGLHSSALLVNLLPSLIYEVSVIAHNQVGRGEPSDAINVTTSEEEPSAPPTDVQVESRGSSTLFVSWKVPPAESLNGKLLGFYIGYRPRFSNLINAQHHLNPSINQLQSNQQQQVNQQQQQQQQQPQLAQTAIQHQSVIYSYKTADAIEGQLFYDVFLTNLKQNQEYEVTVRAFNKAGSGPDCHTISARTSSAKLPSSPNLQVQKVTSNSVTLRWTSTVILGSRLMPANTMTQPGLEILRYVLYYQLQGERDWYELTVASQTLTNQNTADSDLLQLTSPSKQPLVELMGAANELISSQANVHTLSNLHPALIYRIYVSAANDYGIGDPSNVVTVKTDSLNMTSSAYLGAAQLDSSTDTGSSVMNFWNQREHSMLYTLLTSGALILALVLFVAYLIWQRQRNKYTYSSASSSYPTSWTPAACDTIQSEYSVKRFSGSYGVQNQNRAAGSTHDEVVGRQRAPLNQLNQFTGSSTNNEARLINQQRNVNQSGSTVQRPVLSSHYYQPADLISGTLQPHSNVAFSTSRHQSKPSATLNRNQNRQLPPIPYNTMTVRDTTNNSDAAKQWHQGNEYRLRNSQQQ